MFKFENEKLSEVVSFLKNLLSSHDRKENTKDFLKKNFIEKKLYNKEDAESILQRVDKTLNAIDKEYKGIKEAKESGNSRKIYAKERIEEIAKENNISDSDEIFNKMQEQLSLTNENTKILFKELGDALPDEEKKSEK